MKTILVTGGAGFIGVNFIRHLLNSENQVNIINLDKLTYAGSIKNLDDVSSNHNYKFVQGDICDRGLVDKILQEEKVDTVVHFAAESHVDRSITGPAPFINTNIVGTFTLLEAVRSYWLESKQGPGAELCKFHHVSTDEVYGELGPKDPAFTEKTCYAPNSPYSASKASSDHLVRAYHHTYGLPITISNCSNNYGPYQHNEKLIPTVIRSCIHEQEIPVYGDGSNIRDWLYVSDHCEAIKLILEKGENGETYNIGGNCERTNISIVETICQLMDESKPRNKPYKKLIKFVKDRPGHDWRYAIDISRITNDLGWSPQETFKSGLRKTVNWYLN